MGMDVIAQLARAAGGARSGHRQVASPSPLTAISSMAKIAAVVVLMEKDAAGRLDPRTLRDAGNTLLEFGKFSGKAKQLTAGRTLPTQAVGGRVINQPIPPTPIVKSMPGPKLVPTPASTMSSRASAGGTGPVSAPTRTVPHVTRSAVPGPVSAPTRPVPNVTRSAVPSPAATPSSLNSLPTMPTPASLGTASGKWLGRAGVGLGVPAAVGGVYAGRRQISDAIRGDHPIDTYAGAHQEAQRLTESHNAHIQNLADQMKQVETGTYQPTKDQMYAGFNPKTYAAQLKQQHEEAVTGLKTGKYGNMAELQKKMQDARLKLQTTGQNLGGANNVWADRFHGQSPTNMNELQKQQQSKAESFGLNLDDLLKPVPQDTTPPGLKADPGGNKTNQRVFTNHDTVHPVGSVPTTERPNPQESGDYSRVTKRVFGSQ